MRKRWISISRLKVHEFHRTIRHVRNTGRTWHDIYIRLGEIQQEAQSRFLKSLSSLLMVYLLLQSLGKGTNVSLTFSEITASIPIAYVSTVGAIILFVVLQQLQSLLMIMKIRATESVRLKLSGFSAGMYGLFNGQDEMALAIPFLQNRYFKEVFPLSAFLTITTLIVYLSTLLPIIAYSMFLLSWQLHLVLLPTLPWIERIACAVGIFAIFQALLYMFFFNLPLPLKKNKFSIRWGILYRLHPLGIHPRSHFWIQE